MYPCTWYVQKQFYVIVLCTIVPSTWVCTQPNLSNVPFQDPTFLLSTFHFPKAESRKVGP